MKTYEIRISDLDRAILERMGEYEVNGDRLSLSDDVAAELDGVAGHGCESGCASAFTYYRDTCSFYKENRAALRAQLRDQAAEGLFGEGFETAVGAVCAFRCFADEDRATIEEAAARLLFGDIEEALAECDMVHRWLTRSSGARSRTWRAVLTAARSKRLKTEPNHPAVNRGGGAY